MRRLIFRQKPNKLTFISAALLLVVALLSIGLTNLAGGLVRERASDQFDWNTTLITNHFQDVLTDYNTVIYMARAYMANNPNASQTEWAGFFRNQAIFDQFPSMNSISYIQVVPNSQLSSFLAEKRRQPEFGPNYAVTPPGTRDAYAFGVLTVSKNNVPLSGFDVFSTADRKATYDAALASGQPTTSPQIPFSTGPQGMFVTLPVVLAGNNSTFVVLGLYTNDFFNNMVSNANLRRINLQVTDSTNPANKTVLYTTPGWDTATKDFTKNTNIKFGGRTWQFAYRSNLPYGQAVAYHYLPYVMLLAGMLLAVILLLVLHIVFKTEPKRS